MNLRGIVIGVAIFILTLFVAIYGISVFFPQPEYNDFCPEARAAVVVEDAKICENMSGKWFPQEIKCITTPCPQGYCDIDYYCRQDYDDAVEENSKKRFFVSIPVGIAIIALGGVAFALESVGVGLMAGGAGTFVWGSGSYWSYASDVWRFFISLFGLIVLIIFAYWFEKRLKKGFFKRLFRK
jgi:hypothetical protein